MSKKIDNRNEQMFDVRHIEADEFYTQKKEGLVVDLRKKEIFSRPPIKKEEKDIIDSNEDLIDFPDIEEFLDEEIEGDISPVDDFLTDEIFTIEDTDPEELNFSENRKSKIILSVIKKASIILGIIAAALILFFGIFYLFKGAEFKAFLIKDGERAYSNLNEAKESVLNKDFSGSAIQFQAAYDDFDKLSKDINFVGGFIADAIRHLPFFSKISSGKYLAETGKNISKLGIISAGIMQELDKLKNPLQEEDQNVSLLDIFKNINKDIKEAVTLLNKTEKNIKKIDIDDIPEKQRLKFIEFKNQLPQIKGLISAISTNSDIIEEILGGNGPRKYLFLFQNNQEIRATGGFIGTYGILDIFNGHIKKFFIDGIFNPDGQLREKIIPPFPIQKISATWSLHDSNWFPNFPTSAEKAMWFYEKTGGPTTDGVITMTPVIMEKLLGVTGPIEMEEYEVTVNKENFLEIVQQEVEIDYDKELNQPKKILADLAPIVLDRIFNVDNLDDLSKVVSILRESLQEKQILIYSKNKEIEKKIAELGWSGEILETEKDYLSVINSNINGYKTDGVVDEKIELETKIEEDGSIINEVTITRKHNGGNTNYEWWNKVNSNYMRVYVPKGSRLISAEGHTRELHNQPLDYEALEFKKDPEITREESGIDVDPDNGTRVYEDAGKTVFANWVYVSPQETVVVKYKYLLPFKVKVDEEKDEVGIATYSLVAQKQAGSRGSELIATIDFPSYYKSVWEFPEKIVKEEGKIYLETDLIKDRFIGIAFSK